MSKDTRTGALGLAHRLVAVGALVCAALAPSGCSKTSKLSAEKAQAHVEELARTIEGDVSEIRGGLPQGAKHLEHLVKSEGIPEDAQVLRQALEKARNKVQDLRVAKSTFFAVVDPEGLVKRNDQEQDAMAGKNLLASFPELRAALSGKYVEARGSMPEAAAVRGPDGQWVAAYPIKSGDQARALYVTGWSWSAYAYRLENALRGTVRAGLGESEKMPLVYVYMVVDKNVYGAPVSPTVNARAIAEQAPWSKIREAGTTTAELEITGREFGLAVKGTPVLGPDVAVAVLRSET